MQNTESNPTINLAQMVQNGCLPIQLTVNFNAPVGQQIGHVDRIEAHFDKDMKMEILNAGEVITPESQETEAVSIAAEELFHFIHPAVDDAEQLKIHQQVKRLVSQFGIQDICLFLKQLADERKILLPMGAHVAYLELARMGMPTSEKFAEKTFFKHYSSLSRARL